jgi:signal-transduction protein with cAMP-binding, CBS, and nucleotidyltransferase domain
MTEQLEAGLLPVSILATDTVARVAPDASLGVVARAMTDADVGLLVVGRGDDVDGVVSERDIVRAIAAGHDPNTTTAMDVAHTDLAWCDPSATVAEVATEMMERYVRHVLVEDGGRLVGIVSARDLLGAYAAVEARGDT